MGTKKNLPYDFSCSSDGEPYYHYGPSEEEGEYFPKHDELTDIEMQVLSKHELFRRTMGSANFRFYAGITRAGEKWLNIEIEFHNFTDNEPKAVEGWKKIEEFITGFEMQQDMVDEGTYNDECWVTEPGKETRHVVGANHGRPYRQIAAERDVFRMLHPEVEALKKRMVQRIKDLGIEILVVCVW